ncbi:MAG: nucleotide pyrophosphohydrolase [Desulfatiglandales bacterium]
MDDEKSLGVLKKEVEKFRDERDWLKFHSPKNLAVSISIEAAEMLELFQWKDPSAEDIIQEKEFAEALEGELADVLIDCLTMANVLNIDLSTAIERKLKANNEKYPVEEYRGRI